MDSDFPCQDMDTDLYIAAKTGDKDYLQKPHSLQSIPCQATSQKRNALHIAANFKCIGFAEALVEKFPELLTRADFKGDTPLHIASRTGCSNMVKCFLESKNAKQALEMKNERADTALHVAVRNGHLEVVNRLVQENPKLLDLVNNHKESPLYLAVERGFFKIANELLKGNSSECSCEGTKGMTALHAAVIRTHKGPELGKSIPELSVNGLGLHLGGEWFPGTQSNVGQEVPELSLENLRRVVTNFFFRVGGYFKGKHLRVDTNFFFRGKHGRVVTNFFFRGKHGRVVTNFFFRGKHGRVVTNFFFRVRGYFKGKNDKIGKFLCFNKTSIPFVPFLKLIKLK
uniref:Uncharacterized protein n=1 Tax=Vitis vinifera TaxID=29760 RepID=F6HVJ8_VITVI